MNFIAKEFKKCLEDPYILIIFICLEETLSGIININVFKFHLYILLVVLFKGVFNKKSNESI